MKRYLLFAGDNYYAGGGWEDFICDRDTIEEIKCLRSWVKQDNGFDDILKIDHEKWVRDSSSGQWLHIVDLDTAEIVFTETSSERESDRGQIVAN